MKKVIVLSVLAVLAFSAVWAGPVLADDEPLVEAEQQTYVVQPRDSVERVARRFGVTPAELLEANPHAYIHEPHCGRPYLRERPDGTSLPFCGRPEFWLIAGKTLIVPEPRLLVQSDNVRLNAEVVALRAEMDQLRQERETEKAETDALRQERDRLAAANAEQAEANAELRGKYNENQQTSERVLRDYRWVQANASDNTLVLLAVLGFAAVVVFAVIYFYSPGRRLKRLAEQVRRDQDRLASEQQAVARDREEIRRQRQEVEKTAQELADGQAKIADDRRAVLADREILEDQRAALAGQATGMELRKQEMREQGRELNGREVGLFLREEGVIEGERLLAQARRALRQDRQAHHGRMQELTRKEAEVDAKLRTAAEDIPRLEQQKGDVTQRVATVRAREISADEREKKVTAREKAVEAKEGESRQKESSAADQEEILKQRDQDIRTREDGLAAGEDALRTARAEFSGEMDEARRTLEEQVAAQGAAFAKEVADAKSILTRAKRKTEIVRALDAREEKVAADEAANVTEARRLETLRGTLHVWQERLIDRERGQACGDDEPTVVLPLPPEGGVDPSGITHLDAPGSEPAAPAEICTVFCTECGLEGTLDEIEKHQAEAHGATAPGDTGPQIPVADKPSHEESGIYCTTCKRAFSAAEYAVDHAGHDRGLTEPDK